MVVAVILHALVLLSMVRLCVGDGIGVTAYAVETGTGAGAADVIGIVGGCDDGYIMVVCDDGGVGGIWCVGVGVGVVGVYDDVVGCVVVVGVGSAMGCWW